MLEDIFILTELCGLSYTEAKSLTINERKWWLERKRKLIQEQNNQKAPESNPQPKNKPLPAFMQGPSPKRT